MPEPAHKRQLTSTIYATSLMTPTTALGLSTRLSMFELRETGDWDIFQAHGKRRVFSPGAAARHSLPARAYSDSPRTFPPITCNLGRLHNLMLIFPKSFEFVFPRFWPPFSRLFFPFKKPFSSTVRIGSGGLRVARGGSGGSSCHAPGPPERARAEKGGADQWVLKRRELPWFARHRGWKKLPHPWDTYHEFSIKTLLSNKNYALKNASVPCLFLRTIGLKTAKSPW